MQRTRLNTLVNSVGTRTEQFFGNPWRRVSLIIIGLLLGFFVGGALSTISGQSADWDVVAAGVLLLFTELASRFVYRRKSREEKARSQRDPLRGALFTEVLNVFKMGITYSLFLEAFKLGS